MEGVGEGEEEGEKARLKDGRGYMNTYKTSVTVLNQEGHTIKAVLQDNAIADGEKGLGVGVCGNGENTGR